MEGLTPWLETSCRRTTLLRVVQKTLVRRLLFMLRLVLVDSFLDLGACGLRC